MSNTALDQAAVIASIDLHSDSAYIVAYDPRRNSIVLKRRVSSQNNISQLKYQIGRKLNEIGQKSIVIVESGPTTRMLIEYLRDNGFDARMVDARTAARFRQGKHADDWTDAETVARAYSAGLVRELFFPDRNSYELRKSNRIRMDIRKDITRMTLKYQSFVLELTGERHNISSLLRMSYTCLESILGNTRALETAIEFQLQIIQLMRREMGLKKSVSLGLTRNKLFNLLKTMPGVGNSVAATIVLESGNIDQFDGTDEYVSYCGMAGGISTSNGRIKHYNPAHGNTRLKWAFSLAARNAALGKSLKAQAARHFLAKKFKSGRGDLYAYQSLARKLCRSAFQIMKHRKSFDVDLCFGLTDFYEDFD